MIDESDSAPQPGTSAASPPHGSGRPIVLVGMMGSGKSSIGKRLAAQLHLPFHDADDEIETAAGRTISEIFAEHGEAYFRDGERRVIARLLGQGRCVIATGGGAFVQDDTRGLILERGIAVWLDVPLPILIERVGRRNHRPLLAGRDPAQAMREIFAIRKPAYEQAHIRVQSDVGPHSNMVDRLMRALEKHEASMA